MDSVIGCCVRGASHIRAGTVCQDYYKIIEQPEYIIMAVADGHGSSASPYSNDGSRIAADVFCHLLEVYYNQYTSTEDGVDVLENYLRKEGALSLARQIEREWKVQISNWHKDRLRPLPDGDNQFDVEAAIYRQYGTTLLGLMVTKSFVFAFQLGDGDITYVDTLDKRPLIQAEKILGVETFSLSSNEAWKNAISTVAKRKIQESSPCLYILTTDGMMNSFASAEEFYKHCADYYALFQGLPIGKEGVPSSETQESTSWASNIIESLSEAVKPQSTKEKNMEDRETETGIGFLQRNMNSWLQEISKHGSGDDVTVVFYYHEGII